jgi:hypothetical protein
VREGENSVFIGEFQQVLGRLSKVALNVSIERFFTVEESGQVAAAAILFGNGCLCLTWATEEMSKTLADHLAANTRRDTTALGQRMLSEGRRYCFILTDTQDKVSNRLYESSGARTLCEFLRCTIHPATGNEA